MKSKLLSKLPCILALFALSAVTHAQENKPNVVFLSVDDLKPILGAYGFEQVKTPNIDRLGEEGTTMLNTYCQQAICAPSRMSTFTGLRPDSTKVWDLRTQIQDSNPEAVTIQQIFKEAGYTSAGAGKVMHGARSEHPPSWSVPFTSQRKLPFNKNYPIPAHDSAFYQNEHSQEVYQELEASGINHWKKRFNYLREHDAMPSTESMDLPDDAYVDGALAVWATDLLKEYATTGEPFFLTVGFTKPHLPFVAPKKYWDLFDRDEIDLAPFRERAADSPDFAYHNFGELRSYTDITSNWNEDVDDAKQRELIHGYYACVAFIDAQIGKILDTLEETGLAENTIVVLWGDHGYHLGDHGLWNKHSNFEEATHAPLIISAPGFKGGQKATGMTEFVDVFPTLIELAGLKAPYKLEGESLVPVMEDPSTELKEYAISQYPRGGGRMGYALRTDRYRLVMWMKFNWRSTMPFNPAAVEAVELYDYETDPLETVNYANDPAYADVLADLESKMREYFARYAEEPKPVVDVEVESETVEPESSGTVVDLATVDPSSVGTRFASVSKANGKLVIDFEHSPKWPSVDIFAPSGQSWDLSDYGTVDVKLTNNSAFDVKTVAYLANEGDSNRTKKRVGGSADIPAGGTKTIRIDLKSEDYSFNSSQVGWLRIFVNKLQGPAKFTVDSVTANGSPGGTRPTAKAQPTSTAPAAQTNSGNVIYPPPNGQLLDLSDPSKLLTDLRFSKVTGDGNGGLELEFELSPKWPSVSFFAGKGVVWDLSDYTAVEVTMTNPGDQNELMFTYVANPFEDYRNKKTSGSGKVVFGPGETKTIRIPLTGVKDFNPAQVDSVRVFTGKHKAAFKMKLESVRVIR